MGENGPYVLSAVVPQRANSGSKTQFRADNQPEKRGRPRGSRNKMSCAFKEMHRLDALAAFRRQQPHAIIPQR